MINSLVGDPPCADCELADLCKRLRLACKEFHIYAESNKVASCGRYPSRAIYDLVFDGRELTHRQATRRQHQIFRAHAIARDLWRSRELIE